MTGEQIIEEIKRLPASEQARVARLIGELNLPLTREEPGSLTAKRIDESDPAQVEALKEQIVAGFYGEKRTT